ncbi:hypothetical protein CC80DRAFT_187512 [Byssothecium circinans]|uniref:Uncharacterized protein n=1 Tax=Byssothecium circinans TaxID=147558 RepID=A0A6A5TG81_9PLEO|nr:hypothetical protein CC80DRAFT_187512 [Byssothecium circinans]
MPAQTPCPVSNIDRALSPYVNSREDTLKIRRILAKYLTANLRPVNTSTQNQHLVHACPQNLKAAGANPPGLKGTRTEYLEALRAKHAAQTRHRDLQASLDELQNRHSIESPAESQSQCDDEILRSYIALTRQRRGFAELQVIQDSLEKILNANPVSGPKDPKILITKTIGEQPDLPAERLEQASHSDDNGPLILKVKKEVLEASSALERSNAARVKATTAAPGAPQLEEQVFALSRARSEMVEWIQEELGKMEEESGFLDDASPIKRSTEPASTLDLASSETLVRSTYEHYTSSRAAAIKSHESIQWTPWEHQSSIGSQDHSALSGADTKQASGPTKMFTNMLPHLPNLTRIDDNERALLQQAIYLQAQINSADENTAEHLSRLAGESHLLPSGSKSVEAWRKVAVEVGGPTENLVLEHVRDSRQEINRITAIVDLCSLQSQVLSSV